MSREMSRPTLKIHNQPISTTQRVYPFVKWVGGKRSILHELVTRLPRSYSGYHELFVGGGALFFTVQPFNAFLSDINLYLIITFRVIKNQVKQLIKELACHAKHHNKEYYLTCRKRLLTEKNSVTIAGLFIYLNKTCFNGLYRVNKKAGHFNVPMGDYKTPNILDEENLRRASAVLRSTCIEQKPFWQMKPCQDHFYYLDPPYHQAYVSYSEMGFSDNDHKKLADTCKEIDKGGGYFMVSNSDTPWVRKLYKQYHIEKVFALRSVSCQASQRGKHNEVLIRNYTE